MYERRRPALKAASAATATAIVLVALAGLAQDAPPMDTATKGCVEAFGQAQTLRRDGKLRAAREQLVRCSQPQCPALIVGKCVPWLSDIDKAIPSIVVAAQDALGRDVIAVQVSVDGVVVATKLDGLPMPLDPGPHKLRLELAGMPPIERDVVLSQGEKGRRIQVRFAPTKPLATTLPPPPPPPPETRSISPLTYVGFGLGAAGLVLGTVTGIASLANGSALKEDCGGDVCTEAHRDDYDSGLTIAHVSTVGFVIAGLGTTLGVVGLLIGPSPQRAEAIASPTYHLRLGAGHIGFEAQY